MANKIHFVLDESATLGHMPALDDAVDKYRAYNVRLQFYYQSPGQLKKCWPDDQGQTLLSNATKVIFGCNDYQSAEFWSKSLGSGTIIVESGGENRGWSSNSGWSRNYGTSSGSSGTSTNSGSSYSGGSSYSTGSNSGWQQQGRELLKPDEIIGLDPRIAITLTPGVRPVWTRLIRYYEEKSLLKHRGLLRRMIAACRTFFLAALLLLIASAAAKALTHEFLRVTRSPNPHPGMPAINQTPVSIDPRSAPGKSNTFQPPFAPSPPRF